LLTLAGSCKSQGQLGDAKRKLSATQQELHESRAEIHKLKLEAADDQRRFESITRQEAESKQKGRITQGRKMPQARNLVGAGPEADGLHSVRWVSTVFSEPHRNAAEIAALQNELAEQRQLTHQRVEALTQEHMAAAAASARRLAEAEVGLGRSQELQASTEEQLQLATIKIVEREASWAMRERALFEKMEGLQEELRGHEGRRVEWATETELQEAARVSNYQRQSDEVCIWQGRVVGLEGNLEKLKGKLAHAEGRRKVEHAGFQADFSQYRKELAKLIDRVTKMEKRRRQPLAAVDRNQKATRAASAARKRPGSLTLRCGPSAEVKPSVALDEVEESTQVADDLHALTCKMSDMERRLEAGS